MVVWTQVAKADLRRIHDFIAHDSSIYAKKVVHEIIEKTDVLVSYPMIGRVVPEVADQTIREISLYAYRIIYQLHNDNVYILTIVHKRQHIESLTSV